MEEADQVRLVFDILDRFIIKLRIDHWKMSILKREYVNIAHVNRFSAQVFQNRLCEQ